MEQMNITQRLRELLQKYRYVLLVLLAGLLLMWIPEKEEAPVNMAAAQEQPEESLEDALEEILSRIKGAGKVQVLLTEYQGREIIYQTDTDRTDTALRQDTVILSQADREETGLVRQTNPPVYLGALIVCQGGAIPSVKLAMVEAVMSVTGLKSTEITVLEMK